MLPSYLQPLNKKKDDDEEENNGSLPVYFQRLKPMEYKLIESDMKPTTEYEPNSHYSNAGSSSSDLQPSQVLKTTDKKKKGKKPNLFETVVNGLNSGGYEATKQLMSIPKILGSVVPNTLDAILPKNVYDKNDDILLNKIKKSEDYLQKRSDTEIAKNDNATGFNKIVGQGAKFVPQAIEMAGEFAIPMGKIGTVGKALERGAEPIVNLSSKLGTKLPARIAQSGIKTGAEMGLYEGLKSGLEGGKPKDMLNSAKEGAIGGAIFGSGGKAIGEGFKGIGKLKEPKLIEEFKTTQEPIKPLSELKPINPVKSVENTVKPMETIKPQDIIKTDYSKINDEATLNTHIAELENHMKSKLPPLDLQQFAKKLEEAKAQLAKVSKFRSNTIERTTMLSEEQKAKLNPNEFEFITESSKDWQDNAVKAVDKDIKGVMNRIENQTALSGGQDAHEAAIISMRLKEQAEVTGNYQPLVNWLKTVSSKTRESARALKGTDTAWEKKSADGAIMETAKVVDRVEEDIKKSDPKKIERINNQTKQVDQAISQAHEETVSQLANEVNKTGNSQSANKSYNSVGSKDIKKADKVELLPSEILANKIKTTVNPKTPQEKSMIDKMISELFTVAKESPIKGKAPIKANPLENVTDALRNREFYAITWKNAKGIVKEHFKDNPEATKILDDYFEKGIKPPFSMSKFNSAYNQGAKDLKINMGDVVKNYYKTGNETKQGLIDYLVKESGLKGDEAKTLANSIDNRFRQLKKEKSEQYLQGIFKEKVKSASNNNAIGNIEALSNTGGFVNENYKNKVMEKLTPELRKLIGYNPKETVLKAKDPMAMSFDDIVRGGVGKIGVQKELFLKSLQEKLKVNPRDAETILRVANEEFDKLAKDKQTQILKNMFKERPKPVQKSTIDKVMELINLQAYDKASIRDLIKQKEGLPILESNDIKAITYHMNKATEFQKGSNEYNEQIALAREVMENKVPKTFLGKVNSFQTLAMLSSPKTAIRNNLSNGLFRGVTDAKNVIRTGLDIPLSKFTGERTATLPNLKAEGQGIKKGTKDAIFDFKNNIDTRNTDKMELNKNVWDKNGNLFNRTMSNVQRVERLALTDRPFEGAAYADEMARQIKLAKLNGVKFDEAKAIEKAKKEAVYSTFQDDTQFSKIALGLKRLLNADKEWGFGDMVLKFSKTPANITARAVDYTPPVALARAIKAGISKKGFNQEIFIDEISKSVTGAGIIGIGYGLGKMGVINTSGETNSNLRTLKQKVGLGEFTLNLSGINRAVHGGSTKLEKGDLHTSYNWANPTSVLITLGAELSKNKNKTGSLASNVLEGTTQGFNGLIEQPMTTGLQKLFGSHDIGKALITLGTDIPQTFVPSIINNFRQFNNQSNEVYNPNILKQSANKVVNKIPAFNELLPKKVDIMGQDKKGMQNNNPLNIFLNPAITTRYNPDKSTENALNLYNETTNTRILPKLVDKKITINDKVYKLTPKQYNDYQRDLGEQINKIYANNPSEESANSQILKASKKAKENLYEALGDKPKKK